MATEKRLVYLDDILTDLHEVVEAAKADPDEIMRMAEACTGTIIKHLEKFPIVNAVEVVHGRWERRVVDHELPYYFVHDCSICGSSGESYYDYCPNCGAKMDGDGNG